MRQPGMQLIRLGVTASNILRRTETHSLGQTTQHSHPYSSAG